MLPRASRISRDVAAGKLSAEEPLRAALEQADLRNPALLALRTVDRDQALDAARAVDARVQRGAIALPLAGVPIVIKDNVAQKARPSDAGRAAGSGAPAPDDALLLQRLLRAGAVVVGRANMDELAYGVTGTNTHTGQIRNPWDESRHPGGSSAGSAAAVAAGMASLAVGTDTAGSVRIPGALCGLVALRPTPGLIPRDGVAPLAHSFDTAGPIGTCVEDVALMLSVMADRVHLAHAPTEADKDLASCRVLALDGAFASTPSTGVLDVVGRAVEAIGRLGAKVRRGQIAELANAPRASGPVIGAEASFAWKAALAEGPEGFGQEVTGHLQKGATITAVRYLQAQADCHRVATAVHAAFDEADLLVLPTTATTASDACTPGPQLVFLALTVPFSIAGTPALTLPVGLSDGLPVGLQIVARPGSEALLLRVAHQLEQMVEMPGQGS